MVTVYTVDMKVVGSFRIRLCRPEGPHLSVGSTVVVGVSFSFSLVLLSRRVASYECGDALMYMGASG